MIRSLKYGVNEIKYFLRIFVTPHCWIRNHRTNSHWDKFIRQNLINPEFTRATGYTIELNGTSIWIGNYPYASYSNNNVANKGLPSRRTVFRFNDKLNEYFDSL